MPGWPRPRRTPAHRSIHGSYRSFPEQTNCVSVVSGLRRLETGALVRRIARWRPIDIDPTGKSSATTESED
jgi:hypothetical protein